MLSTANLHLYNTSFESNFSIPSISIGKFEIFDISGEIIRYRAGEAPATPAGANGTNASALLGNATNTTDASEV